MEYYVDLDRVLFSGMQRAVALAVDAVASTHGPAAREVAKEFTEAAMNILEQKFDEKLQQIAEMDQRATADNIVKETNAAEGVAYEAAEKAARLAKLAVEDAQKVRSDDTEHAQEKANAALQAAARARDDANATKILANQARECAQKLISAEPGKEARDALHAAAEKVVASHEKAHYSKAWAREAEEAYMVCHRMAERSPVLQPQEHVSQVVTQPEHGIRGDRQKVELPQSAAERKLSEEELAERREDYRRRAAEYEREIASQREKQERDRQLHRE